MKTKKLIEDIIGGGIIATIVSVFTGAFVWALVASWKRFLFFQRPENAYYTVYNTPHQITNAIRVAAAQDPLVLFIFVLPFIVLVLLVIRTIKKGGYTDNIR